MAFQICFTVMAFTACYIKGDIYLFNEVYNGLQTAVNIGKPNNEHFFEQMKQLVNYINRAIPTILSNIELKEMKSLLN
ncbi:hypothetical protein V7148_13545 [Gottfriedia acidiceleris]|uniref:hypothetical protein n=1 Tax=Bacillaceae TaxID=186817 RepID=UPI000BF06AFA|nr:hypothetical protein [Bacillus sp. AFS077874]